MTETFPSDSQEDNFMTPEYREHTDWLIARFARNDRLSELRRKIPEVPPTPEDIERVRLSFQNELAQLQRETEKHTAGPESQTDTPRSNGLHTKGDLVDVAIDHCEHFLSSDQHLIGYTAAYVRDVQTDAILRAEGLEGIFDTSEDPTRFQR